MIYLKRFQLLNEYNHSFYPEFIGLLDGCTPDEYYPLGLFSPGYLQRFEQIDFENITIFYGGNGSGKTTLLNIIAEKLDVFRYKQYLQTEAFTYYINNCEYEYEEKPAVRKFLASDDIFDYILSVREDNKGVRFNKDKEKDFYAVVNDTTKSGYRNVYPDGVNIDFEDPEVNQTIEQFRRFTNAQKKTRRQFVRSRVGEMQRQYSNGENALMFFDKEIEKDALYLLDEPENSMSPKFQLELKTLIENSVRYKNCQFVIATHSPFILSSFDAKIYNLDATPVTVERWHELENVRYYYDFFKMNEMLFE